LPSPRFIKTHLPASLLPDQLWTVKPKIVYVRRNPKDTAVSYFHHHRILQGYTGNMDDFMEAFIDDLTLWSPYHEHVMEFCQMAKTEKNIHLVRFEDMKKNLFKVIEKTAKFLEVDLPTNKLVQLKDHLSFKSMRGKAFCAIYLLEF
jgi:Sulfotransferase domain